jgi:predicted nucleic-acid-binding protein
MIRLDTNYIIRYFMNDNEEMASIAEEAIMNRELFISNEVLSEVVYVLEGVYNLERKKIASVLVDLLMFDNIFTLNENVVTEALKIYAQKKLDFVDCLLCAYSIEDEVLSFDKKLIKCMKDKL